MLNQVAQPKTEDLIGQMCPELEYQVEAEDEDVSTLANAPVSKLSDLIKNGKPTVVCFYANWCSNCTTAPSKMRDFEIESEGGANMLMLCVDGVSKSKNFTKGVGSDSSIINGGLVGSLDAFVNHSVPHYVIISKDGEVLVNYENFHFVKVPVEDGTD